MFGLWAESWTGKMLTFETSRSGGMMLSLRKISCSLGLTLIVMLGVTLAVVGGPFSSPAFGQAGLSTGSIQGAILDPNGSSVPNAKVSITSKATGQTTTPEVTSTGEYNSGPLTPGVYVVRVEAAGFKVFEKTITVQVGGVSSGTTTLEV